jgi:hypothetical protein
MFSWLKIGVKFIKTVSGQEDEKSGLDAPRAAENVSVAESSACRADSIAIQSESPCIATQDSSENQQGPSDLTPIADSIAIQSESLRITPEAASENQQESHCDQTSVADSIGVRPENQILAEVEGPPNGQELARRREIVRKFFNDFWSSRDEKPGKFAERLNQAEDYINERLTACGEAWLLNSATRGQLGLPPQSHWG